MSSAFKIPQSTLDEQFAASDPKRSAWVSANAGSGKTHVLTQRVIRLMLAGNAPDRILCLTFTKAAAANMKNRVFDTLASWTMMEDAALLEEIKKTTGGYPKPETLRRARQLFAESLDTPGGLKIQTIHAFCESLLHQFPLEANVAGHFEVLQDTTQAAMLAEARARVFGDNASPDIEQAFTELLPSASDAAIEEAISEIIAKRQKFRQWVREDHNGVDDAIAALYPALGIEESDTPESLQTAFLQGLAKDEAYFSAIGDFARTTGKSTDSKLADNLSVCANAVTTTERFETWYKVCLTNDGSPRAQKSIATKTVFQAFTELMDRIRAIGEQVHVTNGKIRAIEIIKNTRNLFKVADGVLERYERMKRARGQIDYDDQIWKTVHLLSRPDIRDWIRYRLDQGIDHVLVDEAQDTSPAQWQIINAVTEDFHSGEGASRANRSMFVVGDEKQSIYSFQGADPKEFATQQRALSSRVKAVGEELKNARLALSFRSTKDVLHAVDEVFEHEANAKGLTQDGIAPPHDAVRENDPGEVQVWPLFVKRKQEKPDNWLNPVDREGENDPTVQLASRISATIKDWVGKPLPGTGEALTYGDILILVRKRDRFITALTRTMKDDGVAVAGADRLRLLEHIAIEDLLAIGRFVLLPEDDLNLAGVLKSIIVDLDDKALFALAHNRGKRSLFTQIEKLAADGEAEAHDIAKRVLPILTEMREKGISLGLYDFYAWLLGAQGGRRKILARLGMEAEDVLDAFVDEIVGFTRDGGIGLETFISQLTKANPEIKRELELDRDEVRILTVHASKGLEAKVVFLVDACGNPWNANHRPKVVEIEGDQNKPCLVWAPTKDAQTPATLKATQNYEASVQSEYRRLLYVGMTRAADRLILCGYRGVREPTYSYWHQMVSDALMPTATPILDAEGAEIGLRWVKEERAGRPAQSGSPATRTETKTAEVPAWLFEMAAPEPSLPRPLTPSGAYALLDEELKEHRSPAFEASDQDGTFALDYGNAVHRLMEVLPDIREEERIAKAQSYLDKVAAHWLPQQREGLLRKLFAILESEEFAPIFSSASRAEVPVVGRLGTASGDRLISGQIDRLVIEEARVLIVDYKTNRIVPQRVEDVSSEYVAQLALYRYLLADIYPDRNVEAALLWTNGPELMVLPDALFDDALNEIKKG